MDLIRTFLWLNFKKSIGNIKTQRRRFISFIFSITFSFIVSLIISYFLDKVVSTGTINVKREFLNLFFFSAYIISIFTGIMEYRFDRTMDLRRYKKFPVSNINLLVADIISKLINIYSITLMPIIIVIIKNFSSNLQGALVILLILLFYQIHVILISRLVLLFYQWVKNRFDYYKLILPVVLLASFIIYIIFKFYMLFINSFKTNSLLEIIIKYNLSSNLKYTPPGVTVKSIIGNGYFNQVIYLLLYLSLFSLISALIIILMLKYNNSQFTKIANGKMTPFISGYLPNSLILVIFINDLKKLLRINNLKLGLLNPIPIVIINILVSKTDNYAFTVVTSLAIVVPLLLVGTYGLNYYEMEERGLTALLSAPVSRMQVLIGKSLHILFLIFSEIITIGFVMVILGKINISQIILALFFSIGIALISLALANFISLYFARPAQNILSRGLGKVSLPVYIGYISTNIVISIPLFLIMGVLYNLNQIKAYIFLMPVYLIYSFLIFCLFIFIIRIKFYITDTRIIEKILY